MSLLKMEKPSRDKEKAIRSVQEKEREMVRIGFIIPADMRSNLKINAAKNNVSYTDIVISLIEKYLEAEAKKENN